MNQKEFINKIESISISPLFGGINRFDPVTRKWQPGKRENLQKFELWDHLTVPSNAVHFDLDASSFSANYKIAKKLIAVFDRRNWAYNIYISSRKGIHIESFFNKPKFDFKETKNLFIDALSYNLSFKDIRFWIWNLICDEAGLTKEIKESKIMDKACINFDDLRDKTRYLRVVGGRKTYYDRLTGEDETYYKTWIPKEEFKNRILKIKCIEDVVYPDVIDTFNINESEFSEFLYNYIDFAKNNLQEQNKRIDLSKCGGYINLETVRRIREGLGKGQRSIGAQILAIAMSNDKILLNKQQEIMNEYVGKCSQIGDMFTEKEAYGWIKWVRAQHNVFWNCGLAEEHGLHDASLCDFCKKKNKFAYEFLNDKNILKKILNVLDAEVIGETETKMLMFLLLLSKDFPSKTGTQGWNINSDPMSQNIILSSDSSSGKTYMTKKILKLFGEPNKDYFVISRITKNAINYMTDINMDGKIIFIEEMQGMDEATSQLRLWMSEGELTLKTVEKVKVEGVEVNMSVDKTTTGQPVFISNQAEGVIEDQLNNRSWVLGMDTTSDQTARILEFQDKINEGGDTVNEVEVRKIRDSLKQLKKYHFIIPYADFKAMNIPINDVRSRRDYNKFLTLIKCSAYLHQEQRFIVKDNKDKEYIIADFDDYEIAKQYSFKILGATFSGLSTNQLDVLNYIRNSNWSDEFTISDIMRNLGKSQGHWYGQLRQLEDLGYVTAEHRNGKTSVYSLNSSKTESIINLPNVPILKTSTYYKIDPKSGFFSSKGKTYISIKKTVKEGGILIDTNLYDCLKYIYEGVTISELEKNQPINKSISVEGDFFCTQPSITKTSKVHLHKGGLLIGCEKVGREQIIEFLNLSNKNIVTEEEILNEFNEYEKESVEYIIKQLLKERYIMKYKLGYIIL